jgi:hypothetical protein
MFHCMFSLLHCASDSHYVSQQRLPPFDTCAVAVARAPRGKSIKDSRVRAILGLAIVILPMAGG